MAVSGVWLYGVAMAHARDESAPRPDSGHVRFRDLDALVRPGADGRAPCTPAELRQYAQVVDAAFQRGAVVPAPCGTVFRSAEHLRQWLTENYIALAEGLHFVAGRCETRIHVMPREGGASAPAGTELASAAAECFRRLRRLAVASLPVRGDPARPELCAAFLVDRRGWDRFSSRVRAERERQDALAVMQTGPWPPYDFVRLDFGA